MSEQASFTAMAGPKAEGEAPEIGFGMLGYAFMGRAHSNALKTLPYMMYPPVAVPKLVAISGRDESEVAEAARRYGYQKYFTDWRAMVEAKNRGFTKYDFWGVASENVKKNHPWTGITRFKTGFGGRVINRPGCYDVSFRAFPYRIYRSAEALRTTYYLRWRKRLLRG